MTKRDIVRTVFEGRRAPYVPWHFIFSTDAAALLRAHLGVADLERAVDNHMLMLRRSTGSFRDLGGGRVQDIFGVVWDRTWTRTSASSPDSSCRSRRSATSAFPIRSIHGSTSTGMPQLADGGDRFRVFSASFSLFERAWTLRGPRELMMDFYDNPAFVHELLDLLADFNIAQVNEALKYDIDAVYFGDDWGQQHGLLMSRRTLGRVHPPACRAGCTGPCATRASSS